MENKDNLSPDKQLQVRSQIMKQARWYFPNFSVCYLMMLPVAETVDEWTSMAQWHDDTDRVNLQFLEKHLPQCHSVRH